MKFQKFTRLCGTLSVGESLRATVIEEHHPIGVIIGELSVEEAKVVLL